MDIFANWENVVIMIVVKRELVKHILLQVGLVLLTYVHRDKCAYAERRLECMHIKDIGSKDLLVCVCVVYIQCTLYTVHTHTNTHCGLKMTN